MFDNMKNVHLFICFSTLQICNCPGHWQKPLIVLTTFYKEQVGIFVTFILYILVDHFRWI